MAPGPVDVHSGPARTIDPLPPIDPVLSCARIWFHTNDDDKNEDSRVTVTVFQEDRNSPIAVLSGTFGLLGDHSDLGPVALVMFRTMSRGGFKSAQVEIALDHVGSSFLIPDDTWRFGFLLDLRFSDGGHLFASDDGVVLNYSQGNMRRFPIA
jgi:hypothetical protein